MIALPLLELLEVFLYWAIRYAALALTIAAINAMRIGGFGLGFLTKPLTAGLSFIVHRIEAKIAEAALAVEGSATNFIFGVGNRIDHLAFAVYYAAFRAGEAFRILITSEVPRYVHAVVTGTSTIARNASRAVGALEKDLARDVAHLRSRARTIEREAVRALVAAEHALQHGVTVTLPHALPWVDKRTGTALADAERALHEVWKLRKQIAAAASIAIVARAIARLGFPRVRCRNVNRALRRVCGMDPRLLDDLLFGTVAIIGTVSLIEFAKACQTIEHEVASGVRYFVRLPESV